MENKQEFQSEVYERLSAMRLLVQGALSLYEEEGISLYRFIKKADREDEVIAFDAIGAALYDLKEQILKLHTACARAPKTPC